MRAIYFLSLFILFSTALPAQIIPITNGNIQACEGTFTDTGKDTGAYGPNENYTFTICPGSQGGNTRLTFTQSAFRPGDKLCFYDGTSTNEPLLACSTNFGTEQYAIQATNPTGCLTTVFTSNAYQEGDGWKAEISCTPICQEIKAQLTATSPAIHDNNIDLCVGGEVNFSASALFPNNDQDYHQDIANCTFKWDFGNGQTAQGQQVTHTFDTPGGNAVKLKVIDQYGCESYNSLGINTRVADKPVLSLAANDELTFCASHPFRLSASANSESAQVKITQDEGQFSLIKSHSDSLALPDGDGASYVSTIFYNEFLDGQKLDNPADLKSIFVNMEHSWMRDLEISIECPNGQKAILVHHPGNTGGEVFLGEPNELDEALPEPVPGIGYDYSWSSDATNPNWIDYTNANLPSTLPAGNYQPYEPFTQLVGCPLNGDWKIEVTDLWASDNGFIFAWGLEFDESIYPEGKSFAPQITDIQWSDNKLVMANQQEKIEASAALAGKKKFEIQVSNDYGCTVDTNVTVTILPPTSPDCYHCGDYKAELRDTAICPGQNISYDATFKKALIESLGFEALENTVVTGSDFASTLTVTNVTPGIIGNVAYRVDSIELTFESTQPADLEIYLQSPSGKKLLIGSAIGVVNTSRICFTPNATQSIIGASAPFSGSYNPAGAWSILKGEPTNGDWKLLVQSNNQVPVALKNWDITFKNDVSIGYHWTGNGLSCTDCPTPSMTPTQSGAYIVEVYDNMNCAYQDTAYITVIEALAPPVINEPKYENGQVIFTWLPVQNANGYLVKINNSNWVTPNGTLSQNLNGYVMGDEINFKVKALSAGGCDGSDANLQLKITDCLLTGGHNVVTAPSCVGVDNGEIQLTASNGTPPIEYAFDGAAFQASANYTNVAAGNHFAVIRDGGGCQDTIVFTVDPVKNLSLNINTTDVTCYGANNGTADANITGGATTPITYNWSTSPAQNTQSINSLSPGSYDLTVTDADGCQLNGTATITQPDALTISFDNVQNISCYGLTDGAATAKVSGGTLPYTYQWNSGETTAGIINKAAGTYNVTVTDANGCYEIKSISLTQPTSALTVTANQTVQACAYTNSNKAHALASGGKAPYHFTWSDGQSYDIANNLAPGNYTVTATDDNGCQASTNLSVNELDPVVPTLDFTEPNCYEGSDAGVQVVSIQGGNSTNLNDYTYQWLNQGSTTSSISNVIGDKTYYVTVTGTTGCKGTASVFVTQPTPIELTLASTPVTCAGDQNGTAKVVDIVGNVGPYSIQWDAKAGLATTQEVTNLSGDLYTVTATNTKGCTGTNQVQVKEAPKFEIAKMVTRDPACAGESNGLVSVALSGGAMPYSYQWSNGSTENNINNIGSGSYSFTATDAYGCAISQATELVDPEPVISTAIVQDPNCYGESNATITVTANGGITPYQYSLNNSSFTTDSLIEDLAAGVYPIYVKDDHNCLYVDTVTIIQPPLFSLDAGPDLNLSYAEVTEISVAADNANGEISLMVINPLAEVTECHGCYDININPKYHGVYQVVATDERGCTATDEIDIAITRNQEFLVPTAFTPNGDGANDYLTCHTKHEAKINFFKVYDRWGELIYEKEIGYSNKLSEGWDGTVNGKKMPSGTYIWVASVSFDNGEDIKFKGQTTLIR